MPFTSSQLDYTREQADGTFKCRETHIDDDGTQYVFGPYTVASVAAAEALRDGRFAATLQQRRQREIRNIVRHFRHGGLWNNYTLRVFATKDKARTRLLKLFRAANRKEEYRQCVGYARTVTPLAASRVKTLLGLANNAAGQAVIDRAQEVVDSWNDRQAWVNDTVEDDGSE